MPSIAATGTQAAAIGTLHTLATVTDAGTYLLRVDVAAITAGDVLTLEVSVKTGAGGTSRRAYGISVVGAQVDAVKDSLAIVLPPGRELIATLRQTAGTGRSFPWDLLSL